MIATAVDAQSTRLEALLVLTAAIIAVLILNLIPKLAEPLDRFFTMVHELGHVIAIILTGGRVQKFEVFFTPQDGDIGRATPREEQTGVAFFIAPAGYLGVTLFSAAMMLLSGLPYLAPYTLAILGLVLILLTMIFGEGFSTLLIGLFFGALFIWVAWQAELIWSILLLNLVAIQGAFEALSDLGELGKGFKTSSGGGDDASKMAKIIGCGCSGALVVTTWVIFSIVILGAAFWFTWFRGIAE